MRKSRRLRERRADRTLLLGPLVTGSAPQHSARYTNIAGTISAHTPLMVTTKNALKPACCWCSSVVGMRVAGNPLTLKGYGAPVRD